jgi:hypothetical protein
MLVAHVHDAVHCPSASHVCTALPEHCVAPCVQTHAPPRHTGLVPVHATGDPQMPLDEHVTTALPSHIVWPDVQTLEDASVPASLRPLDVEVDPELDAEVDRDPDPMLDAELDPDPELDGELEPELDPDRGLDAEVDCELDPDGDVDSDRELDADREPSLPSVASGVPLSTGAEGRSGCPRMASHAAAAPRTAAAAVTPSHEARLVIRRSLSEASRPLPAPRSARRRPPSSPRARADGAR